jgi:hypothetical protein
MRTLPDFRNAMSTPTNKQPPAFLAELAPDAVFSATTLRSPVTGPEAITRVVATVGSLYLSMTPLFKGTIGNREFSEYDAEMQNGQRIHGVVTMTRDEKGKILKMVVSQSPLDAVLWLSARLEELLPDLAPGNGR